MFRRQALARGPGLEWGIDDVLTETVHTHDYHPKLPIISLAFEFSFCINMTCNIPSYDTPWLTEDVETDGSEAGC